MIWVVILAAFIPLAHFLVSSEFKKNYNRVNEAFARFDELYKKRCELFLLLISAVKLPFKNDMALVTEVTKVRAKTCSPLLKEEEKIDFDVKVKATIDSVFTTAQNYPDVLTSPQFLDIKSRLNTMEEELVLLRESYNIAAADFNKAVRNFPTNIIAAMMNLHSKNLFSTTK